MSKKLSTEELLASISELKNQVKILESELKKRSEVSGLEQEKFYKAFHSNPALMTISTFQDAKYIDVNDAFLNKLGYTRKEIIGHTSTELQLYVDIIQSDKFFGKLQKLSKVHDFEVTIKTKKGENRTGLFSAETIMLQGEPCLLTTINDITEWKESEKTLRETEYPYSEIFENMSNCVAVYKPVEDGKDFVFVDFNPAAEKTEKIKKEKLIGKKILDIFPGVKEFGLFDLLQRVNETNQPEKKPLSFYQDNRISGWRENFVYKLPSGEIVAIYEDYTELKQNKEKLQRIEQRCREFAELLPEMICEADMNGNISFANSYALENFQYSQEDLKKGVNFDQLLIPRDAKRTRVDLLRRIKGQKLTAREVTAVRKDGTTFPAMASIQPFFEKNKPVGFRGVMMDITSRKKAEEEIQREKSFLEQLIEGAPEAIVQCDTKGNLEKINNEFTQLFGYSRKEALGRNIDELVSSEDQRKEAVGITKEMSGGKKVAIETIRQHKNGTPVDVSILSTPIIVNNKQVGIYAIYRNITERKRADSIRQMIHNISNAVITCQTLDELFKIIREELSTVMDTTNFFIALYEKKTDSLTLPFFKDEKDSFQTFPAGKTITAYVIKKRKPVLLRTKDIEELEKAGEIELVGTYSKVWLGVPLHAENKVIGVVSLQNYDNEDAFDENDLELLEFISNQAGLSIDRKRAEQNLIIAKQKAEEAAKAKQQFLSTMSHEIRTPLNAVLGMTHLLIQANPRSDQMEYLNALKFSGENLLVLINDILDFSKIESGMVFFEQADFKLKEIINGIKQSFLFRTEEKGITFEVNVDPELPDSIVGDPVRLNQVLTNLIGNAIKFTEKGSITVDLTLKQKTTENVEIEFSVSDTGIGIPKDKLANIFESFKQAGTDTTRKYGGTGLGLAITKKLIELQNSEIFVESRIGKGSKFYFSLNFPKSKIKPEHKPVEIKESYKQLEGSNILVAEDNEINFIIAKKLLEKWGAKVDHAENGNVTIDMISKKNYDVVLMDLHMPELNGYEASKIIHTSENVKNKNIPIIALTASVMVDIQQKIEEVGITDYILKPLNPKELYEKVLRKIK